MAYRETAKTRAKKLAVRQRLLESAEALVAREGFRGAAIANVAELAGVATGTVYRHFESKGDLFSEVFRRATEREVAKIAEALHEPGSAVERLDRALRVFSARALRGPTMAWALIAEPAEPQVDQERLIYRQAYAHLFGETIARGIRNGELPEQQTDLVGAAIVGAIAEALIGPLSPNQAKSRQTNQGRSSDSAASTIDAIVAFCLQAVHAQTSLSARPRASLQGLTHEQRTDPEIRLPSESSGR